MLPGLVVAKCEDSLTIGNYRHVINFAAIADSRGNYQSCNRRSNARSPAQRAGAFTIANDIRRRIAEITNELKVKFPRSVYIDDLLFARYFLGDRKDTSYLKEIIKDYPTSDFAAEAKVILELKPN